MALAYVALFFFQVASASLDTLVVATVGRFVITARDLLDSYEFGPAFVKRHPDPLRRHLEYMIYERMIALDAERFQHDTTRFVRDRVAALEEDLAVDELYRDEILSRVELTEKEVEAGVAKASQLSQVRSQEVSAPIEGPDGYYIVRVDEIWQNPLLTESERARLQNEAAKVLRTAKADRMAGEYVRAKMLAANPVMKADGFNIVRAILAEKGLSRDTRVKWDIPSMFMTEAGPLPISASAEFLNRPLAVFAGQTLAVRDYLRWFDIRQFQLKTSSPEAFNSSIKRTIWKMVQDNLLSHEAYGRGFHLRDTVQHETRKWEAKLLYLAGRSHLLRTITLTDADVRRRFEEQRHRYRDSSGKPMKFEQARQHVWADLYSEKAHNVLFRTILRLKKEFPVTVREDILQELSSKIEMEPVPLNVIFYKPGGTFPRVAFPTIDDAWESFE